MLSGAPITPDEDKRLRHIARATFAKDTPQERLVYSIDSADDASSSYDGASLYASKSTSSASSLPLYPLVVAIITVFVIWSGLIIIIIPSSLSPAYLLLVSLYLAVICILIYLSRKYTSTCFH